MEFRDYFCLKNRDSFTIDPKINPDDARFYFGRADVEGRLKKQLRRSFTDPGVPKMVIYGAYGSGKTQTLYHLEHYLMSGEVTSCRLKPRSVHYDLDIQSSSDAANWHLQMVEALGKEVVAGWVKALFDSVPDFQAELKKVFANDLNMAAAANRLREPGGPGLLAWRWFAGQKLSNSELEALGVTRNLGTTGAADLASALIGIGRLAQRNGEVLVFFIDEAEQLMDAAKADCVESLHDYMRKLAEPVNNTVGTIIGSYGLTPDDLAPTLSRPDVRGRIGEQAYIELHNMAAVETVQTFVRELLSALIDREAAHQRIHAEGFGVTLETYPFSSEAFDLFCQFASEDPAKSLPRHIIRALNECAIESWDQGKGIIDEQIVNDIAPIVFG